MLPSRGLLVLILDDDSKRATATAQLVRVLGSIPVIASTEPVAARLLKDADVVLASTSVPFGRRVLLAARPMRRVLRVLAVCPGDLPDDMPIERGLADSAVRAPFTAIALGDLLAKAQARRRAVAEPTVNA